MEFVQNMFVLNVQSQKDELGL